ncbi:MAG: hypothetical protein Q9180_006076 [Flavoplaca navasiana]
MSHRNPVPTDQALARKCRLKARQTTTASPKDRTTTSPRLSTPHRELLEAQLNLAPITERDTPREGVAVGGAPGARYGDSSDNDGDDEDRSRPRRSQLPSCPRANPGSGTGGSDRGRIRRRDPDRDPPGDPSGHGQRELFSVAPHDRSIAYVQQDYKKPPDFKGLKRDHRLADDWLRRHEDFHFFIAVSITIPSAKQTFLTPFSPPISFSQWSTTKDPPPPIILQTLPRPRNSTAASPQRYSTLSKLRNRIPPPPQGNHRYTERF